MGKDPETGHTTRAQAQTLQKISWVWPDVAWQSRLVLTACQEHHLNLLGKHQGDIGIANLLMYHLRFEASGTTIAPPPALDL